MRLRTKKLPKPRKGAWFVQVRRSYLPVSWKGWLTYIPFVLALILSSGFIYRVVFVEINAFANRTMADLVGGAIITALYTIPFYVLIGAIMTWVAIRKS